MAELIKLGGAVFSCVGAVTGITFSAGKEAMTPVLTQVSSDAGNSQVVQKQGYWVLADWGNGVQWKIKSEKLLNPEQLGNQILGFKDVEMTIGGKKIEKGWGFTTQRNGKEYVLHSSSGNYYLLEGDKKLLPGDLRAQWESLGVTKYNEEPLKKWSKSETAPDYDFQFDTCKFARAINQDLIKKGVKLEGLCQLSVHDTWKWARISLTEKDYI